MEVTTFAESRGTVVATEYTHPKNTGIAYVAQWENGDCDIAKLSAEEYKAYKSHELVCILKGKEFNAAGWIFNILV